MYMINELSFYQAAVSPNLDFITFIVIGIFLIILLIVSLILSYRIYKKRNVVVPPVP